MRVDTIFLSFFNSFWSTATKISSHATSSPPCSNGEWWCLSVQTLHLIVPPRLRENQQTLEISAGTCTSDCKMVMCVGCLPNSGELFVGTANAHHELSMTSMKNETKVLTFILSLSWLRNGRSSFTEQSLWCKVTILQVGGGRSPGGII